MELEKGDQPMHGEAVQQQTKLNRIHPKKSTHLRRTHSGTQSPPQTADQLHPANPPQSTDQFLIQYWDVQLKDKRRIEFSTPPST